MNVASNRKMKLVGFMQAQNCSNYPASWRHPAAVSDFLTPAYYQRVAQILESGKFHLAFFDDRLAMPDVYQRDYRESVRHGVRVVKLDLIPLMTAMGLATRHLGIGGTYSTTYHEPYHVARAFATLDHMIGGRAAWNIVTSLNDSEAANFGHDSHLDHDTRYDRADEFMEVVLGHWKTWEPDAIVLDKANGVFANPDKVHRLDHAGPWFRSRGPFTVPPTPQGRPILIQAGQSGRGQRFAARWGDLIFVLYPNFDFAKRSYAEFKSVIGETGRNPDEVCVSTCMYAVTGETRTIAEDKAALIEKLAKPFDTLSLLSEVLNHDFSLHPMDEPFTDADMASISGLQAIRDRVVKLSGNPHPTTRDFVQYSGRGTIHEMPLFVGTPKEVADIMEEWFVGRACDGFVLAATHVPGTYEDFVRLVVPELQKRGLFRTEYEGDTLRENLGIPLPA
ncbi:MAG: monooxygenase [Betaproteobacteria bacterium]